jgi:BASS family bile acid:Na+ symporter
MTDLLLQSLQVCVIALLLAIGMDSRLADLRYLLARPGLLLRSLLAMYVLVPLAALGLIRLLDLPGPLNVALFVLAIAAGAPLLPRKLLRLGHTEYVFGLVVLTSLGAVLTVPASVVLFAPMFEHAGVIGPSAVAGTLAQSFFGPLLLGIVIGWLVPRRAAWLSDRILTIAGIALTMFALALLIVNVRLLVGVGAQALAVLTLMAGIAVAIGYLCGGPHPDGRTILGVACATRHVGVAILVAASLTEPRATALVAAYVVASSIATLIFMRLRSSTAQILPSGVRRP